MLKTRGHVRGGWTNIARLFSVYLLTAILAFASFPHASPAYAGAPPTSTFTVVNANDSGPGSLRAAIAQAGAGANGKIVFDPTLAGQTITLLSDLTAWDMEAQSGSTIGANSSNFEIIGLKDSAGKPAITVNGNGHSGIWASGSGTFSLSDIRFTGFDLNDEASEYAGFGSVLTLSGSNYDTIQVSNVQFDHNKMTSDNMTSIASFDTFAESNEMRIDRVIFADNELRAVNEESSSTQAIVLFGTNTNNATISNSLFSNNKTISHTGADAQGGVLGGFLDYNLKVVNNTFYGNSVTNTGTGQALGPIGYVIQVNEDRSVDFFNNLMIDNKAQDLLVTTFEDAFYKFDGVASTQDSNNLYTGSPFVNAAGGDFHLAGTATAAIDKGDDSQVIGTVDLDGNTRKQGDHVDIGAYESNPVPAADDASLASVLGQTDSSPGGGTGAYGDPITWSLNVANGVTNLDKADIVPADSGAKVWLYDDSDYAGNEGYGVSSLSLPEGGSAIAYIQIDSRDELHVLYYAVTIHRAAGTAPDATPPVLSGIDVSGITQTDATLKATSDEDATLYYVLTTSATPPSALQVAAGQDNVGDAAFKSGNGAATAAVTQSFNVTGLSASTHYYAYFVAKDSAGNASLVGSKDFTTANPPLSDNADLSNLLVTPGSLTFSSMTETYTVNVPYGTTSVDVTPTVADSGATVKVKGETVTSGNAQQVTLDANGSTEIPVVVTAANGVTTKTYTVTVHVDPPVNAATPNITAHPSGATVNVGAAKPTLTVSATKSDAGTLSYQWYSNTTNSNDGGTLIPGATNDSFEASTASAGTTYYYVVVTNTNNDATETKTATATSNAATVTVNALSGNADLSNLTVSLGSMTFAAATKDYTVTVPHGTASIEVTPTVADSGATVTVHGGTTTSGSPRTITLDADGSTWITIVVTAANGSTKTYTITVNEAVQANSTISPTTATFDLNTADTSIGHYRDVTTNMTLNGNALSGIVNGETSLSLGTDYTISDSIVTIKKNYLASRSVGDTTLTFHFSAGSTRTLTIVVGDTTTPASGLTVTSGDPSGASKDGKTKIEVSETLPNGHKWAYMNFGGGTIVVPNVGTALTGYDELPSNGLIPAAHGDKIGVAEVDADGKVVRFGDTTADVTSEPKPNVPKVTADDDSNTIVGANETMEYASNDGPWTAYDSGNPPVFPGTVTVLVRVAADKDADKPAGEAKTIFFTINGTYSVLGTVVDDTPDADYSTGATVKIMKGIAQIGSTATTDALGHFKVTGVPNGNYNLVVTMDDQIITVAVTVKDQDYDFSPRFIVLPRGNKNSELEIKGDTPSVVVDGLNDLFADTQNVYTAEDQQLVADGGSVKITLGVEKLGASAAAGASQLQTLAGGQSLDLYLDMTLTKTRIDTSNQTTRSTLSTVGSLLKIIVPYDLTGKDNVAIYRYHDGAAQKMTLLPYSAATPSTEGYMLDAEGNQIVIWAQNFSTYAVAYGTVGTPPVLGSTSASYTLTAIAGIGGSISPAGTIALTQGGNQTFAIKPDEGYAISDVTVDGKSVGAVGSYTFVSVAEAHTIKAEFSKMKAAGLPYYEEGGSKAFIGFATDASGTMKYIAPSGKSVQFQANPKAFSDIATHWGKSYIDFVTEREIFVGTSDRIFSPDAGMTRAMLATVIGRLYERSYGPLSATDKNVFTDVDDDSWYGAYLDWAADNGIIQGVGGTRFEPDRQVTRQELAAMLYRFAQFIKADTSMLADKTLSYSDATAIDAWASQAALYTQQAGIITGRIDNAFAPKETATRAEVAAMLQRFIETVV